MNDLYVQKVHDLIRGNNITILAITKSYIEVGVHGTYYCEEDVKTFDETFKIHIPLLNKVGELEYGPFRVPNTNMGVLERSVKDYEMLYPAEAVYIRTLGLSAESMYMRPYRGSWVAQKNFKILQGVTNVDNGFYCKLSDAVLLELERGLTIDRARANKNGFPGFTTTNGALLNLLSKYSSLGLQRERERLIWDSRVVYNTPYSAEDESFAVDFTAVPQDVDANQKAQLVDGVDIIESSLVKSQDEHDYSKISSGIPFAGLCNQKRLMVARARYQAMKPLRNEVPYVKNKGGYDLPGINAITLISREIPDDSFIVSKSLAKRLFAVEEITMTYTVPTNTPILMTIAPMEKDLVNASLAMEVMKNKISKGGTLFTYRRLTDIPKEFTIGANEGIETVNVRTSRPFTPTEVTIEDGFAKLPVQVVKIKGFCATTLKVGSKLMDRFGMKGTVSKIVPDMEMPKVYVKYKWIPVDMMYSPKSLKRKVYAAHRFEGIMGMGMMQISDDSHEIEHCQTLESALEEVKGLPRMYTINKLDGNGLSEAPVGVHYIHHLDHDPKQKFNVGISDSAKNGCKLTFVDKYHYRRLEINLGREDYREASQVAMALGYSIDTSGNTPRLKPACEYPKQVVKINRKVDRTHLHRELHTIDPKDIENTVADRVFWNESETYGAVETCKGRILIPPSMSEPIISHDNSLVLSTELITANAIVAEQDSINYLKKEKRDPSRNETRLKMLIDRYHRQLSKRMSAYMRKGYFQRVPGICGVVVINNDLSDDEVGIPEWVHQRYFKRTSFGLVRRHPIHRVYNTPLMKVRPMKDNHVIQLNERVIEMLDGDTDGDLVEVVQIGKITDNMLNYLPSKLLKGRTDIAEKKLNTREIASGDIGWSQHRLKSYTALSGGIALKAMEQVSVAGYGFKQVTEMYHDMAQTSLNCKHSSNQGKLLKIEAISRKYGKHPDQAALLAVEYMEWEGTKDGRRLEAIMSVLPPMELALIRKNVPLEIHSKIARTSVVHYQDELSVVQNANLKEESH